LISISVPDGTVNSGHNCVEDLCSLWAAVCVTSVELPDACKNDDSLWYELENANKSLTIKQNSFSFVDGQTYGNWSNPQSFTITTQDASQFYIAFFLYDFQKSFTSLVDKFSFKVSTDNSFVNYSHPRQFSGPTNVQFSFPSSCQNGGTPLQGGQGCVCTEHYTGTSCQTAICENGGTPDGSTCDCPPNASGDFCENYLNENCYDVATHGDVTPGIKTIYLRINGQFVGTDVYCNNKWTVVQQQYNYGVNFGKGWADYASGFGTLSDDGNFDYWFGNDNLYYLIQSGPTAIRFNMKYCGDDGMFTSTYSSFTLGQASSNYAISVSGYDEATSTAGDGAQWFNGSPFSTYDNDNTGLKCSRFYDNSGFWFSQLYCGSSSFIVPNLNGNFPPNCDNEVATEGILWTPLTGNNQTSHPSLGFASIEVIPSSAL